MLDSWKMALEDLIYSPPSPRRERDLLRAMRVGRSLGTVGSVAELRSAYMRLLRSSAPLALRETSSRTGETGQRQVVDAAFALRHLELSSGRPLDVRRGSPRVALLAWMLAVAA
jgi:hypothetical protein